MGRRRIHTTNAERQQAYRVRLALRNEADRARKSSECGPSPLRKSDEWYTPPAVIALVRRVLGTIDLDPASCAYAQKHVVRATVWYDREANGLERAWLGRVFLNPPYSSPLVGQFTGKLVEEFDAGRVKEAICVVNNATDTKWFKRLFDRFASCFTGRIRFYRSDRKSTQPRLGQVFFYLGENGQRFAEVFSSIGRVVPAPPRKDRLAC